MTQTTIARWSKQPSEGGLASVVQGPRGYRLRANGETILSVSSLRRQSNAWYWYGLGQNTCDAPTKTKDEAKTQADAFYKKWRKENVQV